MKDFKATIYTATVKLSLDLSSPDQGLLVSVNEEDSISGAWLPHSDIRRMIKWLEKAEREVLNKTNEYKVIAKPSKPKFTKELVNKIVKELLK